MVALLLLLLPLLVARVDELNVVAWLPITSGRSVEMELMRDNGEDKESARAGALADAAVHELGAGATDDDNEDDEGGDRFGDHGSGIDDG